MQADPGRAEALLRAGRGLLLYDTLAKAWETVSAGRMLGVKQRAMQWLASAHAAAAKQGPS